MKTAFKITFPIGERLIGVDSDNSGNVLSRWMMLNGLIPIKIQTDRTYSQDDYSHCNGFDILLKETPQGDGFRQIDKGLWESVGSYEMTGRRPDRDEWMKTPEVVQFDTYNFDNGELDQIRFAQFQEGLRMEIGEKRIWLSWYQLDELHEYLERCTLERGGKFEG